MNTFLDTSVMIAAFWGDHEGHEASLRVFSQAARETGACGAHSSAEVYAVMTALPARPPLAPAQALLLVQQIAERLTIVSLEEDEYLNAIRDAGGHGFTGGRIYDALLCWPARENAGQKPYTPGV